MIFNNLSLYSIAPVISVITCSGIFDVCSKNLAIFSTSSKEALISKNELDEIITIPLILNNGELGDLIAFYIDTNKLKNRPIIYIGFNCVGMGQTLITEKLGNFTAAIFGYNNILNDTKAQKKFQSTLLKVVI